MEVIRQLRALNVCIKFTGSQLWMMDTKLVFYNHVYVHTRVCMRIQRRDGVEVVSSPLIIINWTKLFFLFYYISLVHRKKGKYFFFDKHVNFFCSSNQHVVGSTRRIENKLTKNLYPKHVHLYKRTLIAYTINYIPNSLVQVYTSRWMG